MGVALNWSAKMPGEDRVRAHTRTEINEKIDREIEQRLRFYARQDIQTISERINDLDREWDIERVLEANAASVGILGILLGATVSRKWFLLPLVVSGFLLRHALEGWCPPVPILRRLGVRTRLEIERERYALKTLRGDFNQISRDEAGAVRNPEELAQALKE
jgi:hypothetical protein